jgi:hypothetical protein
MTTANNDLIIAENIIDYKYKFSTIDIIFTKNNQNDNYNKEKSFYFILDSNASRDIGYWIFESFIFIKLLVDLNKTNPNIKILSKIENDDIKKLLNYFNINNEIVNKIDNYNNICYSPKIYSIYYIHRLNNDIYFNKFLNNYINYIESKIDNTVNVYNYVFTNINTKNPSYNEEIFNKLKLNANKNNAYFIDNNYENINHNLSIINKAKIIVLLYDAAFFYNCIFLKNKTIIAIDDYPYRPNGFGTHINSNTFLHYLFTIISNRNKIEIMKLADIYN